MRTLLIGLLLTGLEIGGGAFWAQQGSPPPLSVTDPQFIVVYNVKHDAATEPLINLRVVLPAKSEGEAVMKSVVFIQNKLGINTGDMLDFVEVAQRKEAK